MVEIRQVNERFLTDWPGDITGSYLNMPKSGPAKPERLVQAVSVNVPLLPGLAARLQAQERR